MRKSDTRLYSIWENMHRRCEDPKLASYRRYGGRGITVCDDWDQFYWFEQWALGHGYADTLTLDRKDNNKGYSPENCRWASKADQARNTRRTVLVCIDGETLCLADWARRAGLPERTVHQRYRSGWTGAALLAPVGRVQPALKKNTVLVLIGQRAESLATWARETGIGYRTLHRRYHAGVRGEALIKPPETCEK